MFVNDLFKLIENSNEEYYAVYNKRGRPMIMRKPAGKTAEAYAEEKNLTIKGGPFGSHQETESFWIRSVLPGKDKKVDEDRFDKDDRTVRLPPHMTGRDPSKPSVDIPGTPYTVSMRGDDAMTQQDARHFGRYLASVPNPITKAAGMVSQYVGQYDRLPTGEKVARAMDSAGAPSVDRMLRKPMKEQDIDEAGPFSYGAKKPKKGSVADLAAKKRKEQERGKQPVEPKDQRVGVARVTKGVAEAEGQPLSVQQLAMISDEALDNAYGYGRSSPGNTFGWQANLMSAAYAKKMIDAGVTDIEKIADAIHKGWNVTAQKFVQDPDQFDDTEKLRQAGKLDAKLAQRAKLMRIGYFELDNDEQEKDRVVARALLQAIKGEQGVAEGGFDIPEIPRAPQPRPEPKEKTTEGSVQDKLYKRHQDLRKKRGAPDPEYYKELKATYDLPDEERYKKAIELKKKYQVKESSDGSIKYEFTLANGKKDYQISKPTKPGDKAPIDIIGAKTIYKANNPLQKIKSVKVVDKPKEVESKVKNEDRERYLDEMRLAGYEIVTEAATLCPECGGVAYADRMLAEKQDACYHKVKSRYKVWPSAYASGALVRCRKKGAANWGNKSKK